MTKRPPRDRRPRPKTAPRGSTRPREAPRPVRRFRSGGAAIRVSAPSFVDLSADDEGRAVEALADLLVPVLVQAIPQQADSPARTDVTARGEA